MAATAAEVPVEAPVSAAAVAVASSLLPSLIPLPVVGGALDPERESAGHRGASAREIIVLNE